MLGFPELEVATGRQSPLHECFPLWCISPGVFNCVYIILSISPLFKLHEQKIKSKIQCDIFAMFNASNEKNKLYICNVFMLTRLKQTS